MTTPQAELAILEDNIAELEKLVEQQFKTLEFNKAKLSNLKDRKKSMLNYLNSDND
jgi:flagellar biosynthesis/type III secretory pathway chaperone